MNGNIKTANHTERKPINRKMKRVTPQRKEKLVRDEKKNKNQKTNRKRLIMFPLYARQSPCP